MTSPTLRTNVPRDGQSWLDTTERIAAIYGPNAAGKTTVLEAIWAVAQALRTPGHRAVRQPSAGQDAQRPVEYEIDFVADDIRYIYELQIASWGVAFEALYSYPKGSRRTLFIRQQEDENAETEFVKGASLTGPTSEVLKITKTRALFLATAHKYDHKTLTPIARALVAYMGINFITFRDRQDESVLQRVMVEMLGSPTNQVDLVGGLLEAADLGITSVEIKKEKLPEEVTDRLRRVLAALHDGEDEIDEEAIPRLQEIVLFQHRDEDGKQFSLPIENESAGTLTWLTTAWHALNALRDGSILLIDELDASLHPELARYLVKLFSLPQFNVRGAQLLFTTHDVSLLGNAPTRLLEPRNVWFAEKNYSGCSELFSLDEFPTRPGNNSERRYLAGQFGAVPDIDDALLLQYIGTDSSSHGEPIDA